MLKGKLVRLQVLACESGTDILGEGWQGEISIGAARAEPHEQVVIEERFPRTQHLLAFN